MGIQYFKTPDPARLILSTSFSTMMIKVVLALAILFVAVDAECVWGRTAGTGCDTPPQCSYGCHKGSCWSQCNGACSGNDGQCGHCKEWCWLKGESSKYQSCSEASHCWSVRRNSCAGPCSL